MYCVVATEINPQSLRNQGQNESTSKSQAKTEMSVSDTGCLVAITIYFCPTAFIINF